MPYIGLLIAILIIIFQGTIRKYTADYVGNWLISSLKDSTEGNYTLDYDFVRFDIFTKELRIKNFNLTLDTAVVDKEAYLLKYSNLIDLSTPLVVLKLESLWDLMVNEKLLIAYIGMQEPNIKLVRSEHFTQEENQENQQETTEKIRSYLEELEIDSFRILNGAIEVDLQNELQQDLLDFKIRNFTTLLRGFKLDEISPDKPFQGLYAEELELEILDQELILPKLHHKIKFNRLWISSADSIIKLDTLRIQPLASADSSFKSDLFINYIALTGIDFRRAYEENKFDVKKLEINNPDFSLIKKGVAEAVNTSVNLGQLPFEEIILHEIHLNKGTLNLEMNRKFTSEDIYIKVNDYSIDSTMIFVEDLTQNLHNFSFNATNSTIELPDSIHELKIANLAINANDSLALINNIQINPIPSRRKYSLYKERGVGLINYSSIKEIYLKGIDFNQLLSHQQFLIDSIHISSPSTNITEYPYIKKMPGEEEKLFFLISNATVSNGMVNYNKRQFSQNHRSQAQGISLAISQLYPDEDKSMAFDNLNLFIRDGFSEIKTLAHTIKYRNLSSNNLTSLDIEELTFTPDSASIEGEKLNFKSTNVKLRGFNRKQLSSGTLKLDELTAESLSLEADLSDRRKKSENSKLLKKAIINKFYFNKGDFKIVNKKNEFNIADVSTLIDSLQYDATDATRAFPIDFKDLLLNHGVFRFESKEDTTVLSGRLGRFSETDSVINFEDISFKVGNNIKGRLDEIYLRGFDRNALLVENGIKFSYLFLDQPSIEISLTKKSHSTFQLNNDSIRNAILKQFSFIKFDSVLNKNANIKLSSDNRTTDIDNLNIIIGDYLCDTTTSAIDVLQPKEILLNIANITTKSQSDTVSVQALSLDMINNTLFTGNIDITTHQDRGYIKVLIPGLVANGFTGSGLLSNDYSVDTIRLSNARVSMVTNDTIDSSIDISRANKDMGTSIRGLFKKSNKLMYDTLFKVNNKVLNIDEVELDSSNNINFKNILSKLKLARKKDIEEVTPTEVVHDDSLIKVTLSKKALSTHGIIKHIELHNSAFVWQENDKVHSFLSGLNFSIDVTNLILDTLNEFSVYNHIHDLSIKIKDYKLNLPDSLNRFSFDEMNLSTQDESIAIKNISLTPRVDKYDYADKVGHQAGWHKLQNLDINIDKLNMFKLLSEKVLYVEKINTINGSLDIFKDKELPIPVNQRRAMLQDVIRRINLPIHIDSIEVDNFRVNFSSRLNSKMPEGSLNFHELNAHVTNLVNIDSAIIKNAYLNIKASSKVMNKGTLTANFDLDLGDENNAFKFDAHLSAMSATEFNSLLEALAFVSVESGTIKDLSLQAQGDNYYATGNMKFLYNDLKVSTINKKNLKTKGMGKVMKTFFANAFVVKKNNPVFKLFPRDGAMYYERDPQKIIIDYVTKTALSGVVSSIGARNARKDIKKMTKESKKQKDAERKALKKATKKGVA
jgi:hypothetical protein